MASKSNSRRWIVLGLVALGVAVAATLPRGGTDDAEQDSEPTEAREGSGQEAPLTNKQLDGGTASRRVAEGCDPIAESLKYEEFIGRRVLAILSWNNMSERAANLQIPVYVVGIEDGAVGIRVLEIPMREQYLSVWLISGHLKQGPEDTVLLDPCSARIIPWEAMDRAQAGTSDDDEEIYDQDGFIKDEYLLEDGDEQ